MSLNMQLHQLRLRTANGESAYNFKPGLNIVTGSYGTGKSSMFELIKYALGAKSAELMPAIQEHLLVVVLTVTLGSHRIEMTRQVGKNRILVSFLGESDRVENWSATRIKSAELASDRILELLGVPNVRMARRGASGSSVAVSFFDIFRYVYLPQADVPRSVVGHADPFLDPKRKAVLELAYGLSDSVVSSLEVDVVEFEKLRDRAIVEERAVAEFLERAGAPGRDDLTVGIEIANSALRKAQHRLDESRALAAQKTTIDDQSGLRNHIARLRVLTADYESERAIAATAVDRYSSLLAQVNLDLQREKRSDHAHDSLSGFEFTNCPRCLQSLPTEVSSGFCLLCRQVEPRRAEVSDIESLENQLSETAELLHFEELRLESAGRQAQVFRRELNDVVQELESQLAPELVLPSIDQVSSATSDVERARAQVREMERFQDQWDTQSEYIQAIEDLRSKIESAKKDVEAARAELERNRFRLTSLGEYFRDEVRELGFGSNIDADIDDNYLPVINGDTFEQLSVAGARKVLANDAYYLASLSNALTDQDILLPGLLILDGPRTSLGDTAEDKQAGERLYYRFRLLADTYSTAQIIVADNGYPTLGPGSRPVNIISLSYEYPLLKDVPHPGEGRVPTVGQSAVDG